MTNRDNDNSEEPWGPDAWVCIIAGAVSGLIVAIGIYAALGGPWPW